MFAGVPSQGASAASWLLARTMEEASIAGGGVTAMATDIYKCFDQVVRELVCVVALWTGCPPAIVSAWH
eukprot:12834387-Alexandrium_andersonii.AAC.1